MSGIFILIISPVVCLSSQWFHRIWLCIKYKWLLKKNSYPNILWDFSLYLPNTNRLQLISNDISTNLHHDTWLLIFGCHGNMKHCCKICVKSDFAWDFKKGNKSTYLFNCRYLASKLSVVIDAAVILNITSEIAKFIVKKLGPKP